MTTPAESGDPISRLSSPSDILAAIPYVVGYHPTDSIVVVGMHGPRISFTARDDLPLLEDHEDAVRDRIDHLVSVVARQRCTGVLIIGYGPATRADPVAVGLWEAFERIGIVVREVLRAGRDRYWSYLCRNARCCPPEGVPYDAVNSPIAAEWTVAGRVARRNRSEYEAQISSLDGAARDAMGAATAAAHERLITLLASGDDERAVQAALRKAGETAITAALNRHLAGGRLTDEDIGWLCVLLVDVEVRDIAWRRIQGPLETVDQHRALWMDVLRRCEPDLVAPPACLFAFAAWRCGDGGMARLALERALTQQPGYYMADLLLDALCRGVPPSALDDFPDLQVTPRRVPRRRKRSSSRRAKSRRG